MEKKYLDYMLEQLKNLMAIDSPSGFNEEVSAYLNKEITALGLKPQGPFKGGVTAELGGEGSPIMLVAHVDTLGAVVKFIKPDGRLALAPVGALSPNNIETENVRVHTRFNGALEGTVQIFNPSMHVNKNVNAPRTFEDNIEIVLDEFVKTAEDADALGVCAGDFIALDPRLTVTSKGYIKSRFLDDKASAAILLAFAKYVKEQNVKLSRNTWLNFTFYEEIGYGGTCGIPETMEELLAVDMGCVGEGVTCTERQVSICAKDMGGPYNYERTTALVKCAKDNGIDYAVDVYNYYMSDVEVSLRAGYDVKHTLIGPGVYASHGYERTHIDGLVNTFKLIEAYLKG